MSACAPSFVDPQLHYWAREKSGAEVDYVVQMQNESALLPIEVKAGKSGTLRSLHVMMREKGLKTALRLYTDLPRIDRIQAEGLDYTLVSRPLYLTDFYRNFLRAL